MTIIVKITNFKILPENFEAKLIKPFATEEETPYEFSNLDIFLTHVLTLFWT